MILLGLDPPIDARATLIRGRWTKETEILRRVFLDNPFRVPEHRITVRRAGIVRFDLDGDTADRVLRVQEDMPR